MPDAGLIDDIFAGVQLGGEQRAVGLFLVHDDHPRGTKNHFATQWMHFHMAHGALKVNRLTRRPSKANTASMTATYLVPVHAGEFGFGHRPTVAAKVDYALRHIDGSHEYLRGEQ